MQTKKYYDFQSGLHFFLYLCCIKSYHIVASNEEPRNTNGCYLVTQFSSNPNNRLILR